MLPFRPGNRWRAATAAAATAAKKEPESNRDLKTPSYLSAAATRLLLGYCTFCNQTVSLGIRPELVHSGGLDCCSLAGAKTLPLVAVLQASKMKDTHTHANFISQLACERQGRTQEAILRSILRRINMAAATATVMRRMRRRMAVAS